MISLLLAISICKAETLTHESRIVSLSSRNVRAEIIRIPLQSYRIQIGLGGDRIGGTEPLAALAKRKGALAAINGSFFDAYSSSAIKPPHHTVITEGEVAHIGNTGSLIGFRGTGDAVIGRLELSIVGARERQEKWPYRWYAYWVNRNPASPTVTLFTRFWGKETGVSDGRQVVVENGLVNRIEQASQPIPRNGFVLYQRGVEDSSFKNIRMGSALSYRIVNKFDPTGSWGRFADVREAVGAGPTLVADGKVTLDPEREGFSDPKILTGAGARSVVGLTRDGMALFVASNGTMREMAELMRALGCHAAMNLDGGASSGLIFRGKAIRSPGREISNAMLVLPRR